MHFILLSRKGLPLLKRQLGQTTLTIGRDPDCDFPLCDEQVSRQHCIIEWRENQYHLVNKGQNGTWLENQAISDHALSSGDRLRIGPWEILYTEELYVPVTSQETVSTDYKPTEILRYDVEKNELTSFSIVVNDRVFTNLKISIGSAPDNDIVIDNDPYVSQKHCRIYRDQFGFWVEDLGSTNGTWMEDRRIDVTPLGYEGKLRVGKTFVTYGIRPFREKMVRSSKTSLGAMVGKSRAMQELYTLLEKVGISDVSACLMGESGTGKELAAQCLHRLSPRMHGPFVALNCGAVPATLMESELFGHEKGAFTGAGERRPGVFEQAHGGTLFLDEIGEMPWDMQSRLLRVLESKTVRRVGGQTEIPFDVRILTATHRNLNQLIQQGSFREDLYYRLYVIPIRIPALRERTEDIPLLAEHFLKLFAPTDVEKKFTPSALEKLLSITWRGNVRELKNTVQRALLLSNNEWVDASSIVTSPLESKTEENAPLFQQERETILNALMQQRWNRTRAAKQLGIARSTLNSKIKQYKIEP